MSRLLAILICLGSYVSLQAQNLSGNWTGYFTSNSELNGNTYTYELHITSGNNQQIKATTLTKFSNQSTATAIARGVYTPNIQLLNIQETKFDMLHLDPNMQACLMNNYLTYSNINGKSILQGTYMAKNAINGKDCGTGTVYLMKEDPIVRIPMVKEKKAITKNIKVNSNDSLSNKKQTSSIVATKIMVNNKTFTSTQNKDSNNLAAIKTNATLNTETSKTNSDIKSTSTSLSIAPKAITFKEKEPTHEHILMPWVLLSRENNYIKKIVTHNKSISFDLYDNGTIDNDTITIYDNKKLMLDKNRLSYKPIHIDLNFTDTDNVHEIIVVANNLGSVPPNTALLMYKVESQTEELLINTNLKTNAKFIIEYQPLKKNK